MCSCLRDLFNNHFYVLPRYDHREELKTLSGKLREMEARWEALYTQHQEVVEERCELEEAENDSRLRAQK